MKLIIDIPDEEYKTLSKTSEKEKVNELSYYERVIANGTPYEPKGDLISREALKKYARIVNDKDLGRLHVVDVSDIDNAPIVEIPCNQIIWEQGYECGKNERPQGEWIPVSERLPDKNMPCLVSVGKLNLTKIAMYSDLMETINHKIFWQGDYGKNNFQNITEYVNAWQSLPEPYKKGGKEI